MTRKPPFTNRLSLFTDQGERKYLSDNERQSFLNALSILKSPQERLFCEMIFWTGCRPSEALSLTPLHIDLDEQRVIIRSLKKRGSQKGRHYRPIPLPSEYLQRLDGFYRIKKLSEKEHSGLDQKLWKFGRTKGWRLIKTVMGQAGIQGAKACGRGLRHSYGVHAAVAQIPETRIKKWLGHESLTTTEVYLDFAAHEDRLLAKRMW